MITQFEEDKPKLWAAIYGYISKESIDQMKSEPEDCKETYVSKDPLTLWLLIQRTHLNIALRERGPEEVCADVRREFVGIKMLTVEYRV